MEDVSRRLKQASKGLSVLFAEDNYQFRERMMRLLLIPLEFARLDEAGDGNGAMFQFDKRSYHLIITDFDMPGITGGELIHRIHEKKPQQQVLILTSHDALVSVRDTFRSSSNVHLIRKNDAEEAMTREGSQKFWNSFSRAVMFSRLQDMG